MAIAVIPCRGGSKRIPRKNIKLMKGKPLFQYSVELAFNSGLFENIYVSTDDKEIAERATDLGVEVHWRKEVDDKQTLAEVWAMFPTPICCILPNPLTRVEDLVKSSEIPGDVWSAIRVQQDPPLFQDAGQFYWIRGGGMSLYVVDEAVDINTMEDWNLAESKL